MKILIRQKSGLGNQLFQYAAGLYFAKQYDATLEVLREPEDRAVSFGHPRQFLLSKFCISAPVRGWTTRDRLMCSTAGYKKPVSRSARLLSRTRVYRQDFHTDWQFLPTLPVPAGTRSLYVEGYFQAHQYLEQVEPQLRKELAFREPAAAKNLDMLDQIRSSESPVSIHIRRGDYTSIYGGRDALPMTYYNNAIRVVEEHMQNPCFFVFSDDIGFARENLPQTGRFVFVDHNDQTNAHEDLRLMSACRHHIIANSTFSYWGAWLNADPAKLVIAPDRWLDPEVPHPDLIPSTWRRVTTNSV